MLQVNAIGSIVHDPAFVTTCAGAAILLPNGYELERPVFRSADAGTQEAEGESAGPETAGSAAAKHTSIRPVVLAFREPTRRNPLTASGHVCDDLFFTLRIHVSEAAGAGPGGALAVFTITRSDAPGEKIYTTTQGLSRVWRLAWEGAVSDFPERRAQLNFPGVSRGRPNFQGVVLAGLSLRPVLQVVQALPGAAAALTAFGPAAIAAAVKPPTHAIPTTSTLPSKNTVARASGGTGQAPQEAPLIMRLMSKQTTLSQVPASTAPQALRGGVKLPGPLPRSRKPVALASSTSGSARGGGCPACGLAGVPFCAVTGQPHAGGLGGGGEPCRACGLAGVPFCPISGQPHGLPDVVMVPSTTDAHATKPKTSHSSARAGGRGGGAGAGARKGVRTGIPTGVAGAEGKGKGPRTATPAGSNETNLAGESERHPRLTGRKRQHKDSIHATAETDEGSVKRRPGSKTRRATLSPSGSSSSAGGSGTHLIQIRLEDSVGGGGGKPHPRRSKPSAGREKAPTSASSASSAAAVEGLPGMWSPEQPPSLRQPLPASEQHRAGSLWVKKFRSSFDCETKMPEATKAAPSTTSASAVLPACVAAVPLAPVIVRRRVLTGVKKTKAPKKENGKGTAATDAGAAEKEEEEEEGDKEEANALEEAKTPCSPASKVLRLAVHPLEVSDSLTSLSMRRLMKFLWQYTSERSKLDLLRSPAGRGFKKDSINTTSPSRAGAGPDGTAEEGATCVEASQAEAGGEENVSSTAPVLQV